MKKSLFLLMVLLLYSMWSVASLAQESKGPLATILQDAEEINNDNRDKLYKIMTLDVFGYFDLSDYNTDLKKNMFMKTTEYTNKVNELKKLKHTSALRTYYVILKGERFKDYDVNRKGFKVKLGENITLSGIINRWGPPKSISMILFPALPTESEESKSGLLPKGIKTEYLFLPMNEKNGLSVENNKSDTKAYLFFSPADAKKISYDHYAAGGNHGWLTIKDDCIIAKSVRVIVANEESGQIYLDKVYK